MLFVKNVLTYWVVSFIFENGILWKMFGCPYKWFLRDLVSKWAQDTLLSKIVYPSLILFFETVNALKGH